MKRSNSSSWLGLFKIGLNPFLLFPYENRRAQVANDAAQQKAESIT
jgi:hypothetical protein